MTQKIRKFHPLLSSTICPLCKVVTNSITDQQSTEIICINCGSVIDDKLLDTPILKDFSKVNKK